jgi:hypothetical protein
MPVGYICTILTRNSHSTLISQSSNPRPQNAMTGADVLFTREADTPTLGQARRAIARRRSKITCFHPESGKAGRTAWSAAGTTCGCHFSKYPAPRNRASKVSAAALVSTRRRRHQRHQRCHDGVNVVEDKITLLRSPNSNNVGAPHAPSRRAKPPGKLISHQTDLKGVAEACEREHRGGHRAHAARCAWGWPGDHSAAAVSSAAVARHTPRPRCASPAFGR